VQRAPSLARAVLEGSILELAAQMTSVWCKVYTPAGSKGVRVLKWGTGWFIVQLLSFLLAPQVLAESWSDASASLTAVMRSWGQSLCNS